MLSQIHLLLAIASAIVTGVVGLEAGWRLVTDVAAARLSGVLGRTQLFVVAATAVVGVLLVASGESAGNGLHYLLAVIALLSVPAAPMAVMRAGDRTRAAATCVAAVAALVAVALLFVTG